jgi:hypothetical protein
MAIATKTKEEYLTSYAEGWSAGDVAKIIESTAPSYNLYDPKSDPTTIPRAKMVEYLTGLKDAVRKQLGHLPSPFMEITEVMVKEEDGKIKAWCKWLVRGVVVGAGLIVVADNGIESETLFYFA